MALNEEEYLLIKLIEECSEVIKASTKWLRFGKNNYCPRDKRKVSNVDELRQELANVTAARIMLSDITKEQLATDNPIKVGHHIDKTRRYMDISEREGRLRKDKVK
jgi:NTP pyrophosphatase (non-canonical NTP hydrolase)